MSPACQKSLNKPVSGMQALCRAPLSSACSGNGGAAKIVPPHPRTPLNAIENLRGVRPSRALRRFFDSLQHFRQDAPYFTSLFVRRRGVPPLPSSSAFAGIFQISGRKNCPAPPARAAGYDWTFENALAFSSPPETAVWRGAPPFSSAGAIFTKMA